MAAIASPLQGRQSRDGATAGSYRPLRIFVPHASDMLTDHRAHGDGLVAFEVVSRLAARGHHVHVMAPRVDIAGAIPATMYVHRYTGPNLRSLRGRLAYLRAVRKQFGTLRARERIDVVHQLNPVSSGVSLAFAGCGVPIVLGAYVAPWPVESDSASIRGALDFPFVSLLRHAVVLAEQRMARALIVTTPAAEAKIDRSRRVRAKIVTIPHGIDPGRYDGRADQIDRDASQTILFLGGTERRKGIYVLLEAFAIVRRALPSARLLIAGAGGREDEVEASVRTMPERGAIELIGEIGRGDIPGLMRRACVFAAPSFGEPFGMALLEAMASAKPVVVTDAGGPAHIVAEGGGFKVPAGRADLLADALLTILRSPDEARRMGAANRRAVETTYAWDGVIDRVENVYATVVKRHP